ncbi:MAG: helix-turn-helix transcriptional regulator [Dehalococcoidia bacterium]
MITNQRQYYTTRHELERFKVALLAAGNQPIEDRQLLHQTYVAAMKGEIEELERQIEAYESLQAGRVSSWRVASLLDLPEALIAARIAAGLSQADLAARLGMKAQQIQRYEATTYESAGFARLVEVADALNIQVTGRVELPAREAPTA